MTGGRRDLPAFLLTVTLIALAAANSLVYFVRLDLTRNRSFTISPVSRELFREIPEKVRLTYYVSDRLRKLSPIPGRIEDLLREYAAHGRGRIEVSVLAPEKMDPPVRPESLGIVPQQIQVVERNENTIATVYTGILISYLDSRDTLPVVFDTADLEYRLTRGIRKLVSGAEPAVGFLIGRPGSSLSSEFRLLADRLSRSYKVMELARGEAIPRDLSALLVVGGRELEERDLHPVDAFITEGGRALFAVDGVEVDLDRNLQAAAVGDQPLLRLLSAWGVEVGRELVLDARCALMPVQRNTGAVVVRTLEKYNHWVKAQGRGLSRTSPITAGLQALDLYWPSPLSLKPPAGVEAETLVSSSGDSWLMREKFSTNPYEAPLFRTLAADSSGGYVLAAALTGPFPPVFIGGQGARPARAAAPASGPASGPGPDLGSGTGAAPASGHGPAALNSDPAPLSRTAPGSEPGGGSAAASPSRAARIIVVGDSEAPTDLSQFSDGAGNIDFFENAVDWLAGDRGLLEIRVRGSRDTGLGRIEDPGMRNAVLLFSRMVNLFVVPAGLIFYGLYRAWRRRSVHDR